MKSVSSMNNLFVRAAIAVVMLMSVMVLLPEKARASHLSGAGYAVTDSTEPGGPTFLWEDISTTGTPLSAGFFGDDRAEGPLPLGFNFSFFGNTYSEVYASSNSLLTFSGPSGQYSNLSIPEPRDTNNMIAAFWDDLTTGCPGTEVFYETRGSAPNRQFIFMWKNVNHLYQSCGAPGSVYSFEVKLLEGSNGIEVHYLSADSADSVTLGIENSDGTAGITYYNGPTPNMSSKAVRYGEPQVKSGDIGTTYHWLNVSKAGDGEGTVRSDGYGIDCGTDCAERYAQATLLDLVATPAEGSVFTGWSGDCSGAGTCRVHMMDQRDVTATFAIAEPVDPDDDADGIPESTDNCGAAANPGQEDADGDGVGDACDPDRDGDEVANDTDNCLDAANPDQTDGDGDGQGDACDEDSGQDLVQRGPCAGATINSRTPLSGGGEMIVGSPMADVVSGTDGDDIFCGLGGNDVLTGLAGNDQIVGNAGDDTINGRDGDDTLQGGSGVDSLSGGAGQDTLRGWTMDDVLRGKGGDDLLIGNAGDDTLLGGTGRSDRCRGGRGEDLVRGCER